MPIDGLEAVADAIMKFEGWRPGSRSYVNRNPGNLRSSQWQSGSDEKGYAIFIDMGAGYWALYNDLKNKFIGNNKHNLNGYSTLQDLMNVYAPAGDANDPHVYAHFVAAWVSAALGRPISATSPLMDIAPDLYPAYPAPPGSVPRVA